MAVEFRLKTARGPTAVVMAACLHVLALALLAWRLGSDPRAAPSPEMNVVLAPSWVRLEPDRRKAPVRKANMAAAPLRTRPPQPETIVAPAPPAPAAAPLDSGNGGLRPVLRGLLGCEHAALAQLTPEERERCSARLAARAEPSVRTRLDLDVRGDFTGNPDPYLARKPHNGCKIGAGGDTGVLGKQGAAAGVACARPF
jgi:hypothetical protein